MCSQYITKPFMLCQDWDLRLYYHNLVFMFFSLKEEIETPILNVYVLLSLSLFMFIRIFNCCQLAIQGTIKFNLNKAFVILYSTMNNVCMFVVSMVEIIFHQRIQLREYVKNNSIKFYMLKFICQSSLQLLYFTRLYDENVSNSIILPETSKFLVNMNYYKSVRKTQYGL